MWHFKIETYCDVHIVSTCLTREWWQTNMLSQEPALLMPFPGDLGLANSPFFLHWFLWVVRFMFNGLLLNQYCQSTERNCLTANQPMGMPYRRLVFPWWWRLLLLVSIIWIVVEWFLLQVIQFTRVTSLFSPLFSPALCEACGECISLHNAGRCLIEWQACGCQSNVSSSCLIDTLPSRPLMEPRTL